MKHCDSIRHTRGESRFIDDMPLPAGTLHAHVFSSRIPCGRIVELELSAARRAPGVRGVFTAADIKGENQIGGIIADEQLLAGEEVTFLGESIALVAADTKEHARDAAALIQCVFEERQGIFDPREAAAQGELIAPARTLRLGDVEQTWPLCETVVEGRVETGAQEHLYLETQSALAVPRERGAMLLYSATQSPTVVQRAVARVLGIPMNRVEIVVPRLGGAFGGKEDQATPWAVMAALAASSLGRPVKIVLNRQEDLRLTGKRHPYSCDYKIGLSEDGKILAYEAVLYQNAGAVADLSTAILERSLFHGTSAYFIPNARITALSCRTNLPPFTAFRGFGAPQAVFCVEAALAHAASAMGRKKEELQRANLLQDGNLLPFGMAVENSTAGRTFDEATERFAWNDTVRRIEEFNRDHRFQKKGAAIMPVCFGISFTSTFLNQAGALVHVYGDGSVAINTGAVEMGQGVNAKLAVIAARTLGIRAERIIQEDTDTSRVANTSPTAASSAADMNGKALEQACAEIADRLREVAGKLLKTDPVRLIFREGIVFDGDRGTELTFDEAVAAAYRTRVDLSAHSHYATPNINYDKTTETGRPFAYHVFGAGIIEVTLDCLRGRYTIDSVKVVQDAGRSIDPLIDLGQVEGGIVQGLGWMTLEEVRYEKGRLLTDSLSTLKIPDLNFAPRIEAAFLENAANPRAVMGSKAVGEPPFLYGIGAYFALLAAIRAYNPNCPLSFIAPLTPERVFFMLHG